MTSIYLLITFIKIIEKFIWQCVLVILLVVYKFLVMKAEITVASYYGRDFTIKIAIVHCFRLYLMKRFWKTLNFILYVLEMLLKIK
jgi:hypothetical protein